MELANPRAALTARKITAFMKPRDAMDVAPKQEPGAIRPCPERRFRVAAIPVLLISLTISRLLGGDESPLLIIRGGHMFNSTTGLMEPLGALVIKGGSISEKLPAGRALAIPAGAKVIEADGKFLLPGFIDGHAHVGHVLGAAGVRAEEILPLYLANGVTTLRNVGDLLDDQQRITKFIAAHPGQTPRLFLGSPLFDKSPPYHAGASIPITSAEQVPPFVERLAAADVRTFKIYVGMDRTIGGTIIREAHRHGRRATAHLRRYPPLEAIADGIDSLEHIESVFDFVTPPEVPVWPLRDERTHMAALAVASLRKRLLEEQIKTDFSSARAVELVETLARRQVMVDPTLVVYRNWMLLGDVEEMLQHPDLAKIPARLRNYWSSTAGGAGAGPEIADLRRRQMVKLQELTGVLYRAGVPLLVGTDAPIHFCPPGFALHQELELLVASGVPPAAVLTAATRNNAQALDEWHRLGSIEPGKLADLVLLDADPLADIRNTRRIVRVIRGGIVCDPAALLALVPAE